MCCDPHNRTLQAIGVATYQVPNAVDRSLPALERYHGGLRSPRRARTVILLALCTDEAISEASGVHHSFGRCCCVVDFGACCVPPRYGKPRRHAAVGRVEDSGPVRRPEDIASGKEAAGCLIDAIVVGNDALTHRRAAGAFSQQPRSSSPSTTRSRPARTGYCRAASTSARLRLGSDFRTDAGGRNTIPRLSAAHMGCGRTLQAVHHQCLDGCIHLAAFPQCRL
jgi:hypothetical protein